MELKKIMWFLVILVGTNLAGLKMPVYGAPIFPPSDNHPLEMPTEKTDNAPEAVEQNTSTETANLHKDTTYSLSQIEVKVLYGVNQNGEKSYKTTYQLADVLHNKSMSSKDPKIIVTYKDKKDTGKYAVSEVYVKKTNNNSYQVTAKIIEATAGETLKPKIIHLD